MAVADAEPVISTQADSTQKYAVQGSLLIDISDSIRNKNGTATQYEIDDMPLAISLLGSGSSPGGISVFEFGGTNSRLVSTHYEKWTKADTSFVTGTTAHSSATQIMASVSNKYTTASLTLGDLDGCVIQRVLITPTYASDATNTERVVKTAYTVASPWCKRVNDASSTNLDNRTYRYFIDTATSTVVSYYYSSSGAYNIGTTPYGINVSLSKPSVASTTASSTTIRVTSPAIRDQYYSGYMSQSNLLKLQDFTVEWYVEVYTMDARSSLADAIVHSNQDMLLNGITQKTV